MHALQCTILILATITKSLLQERNNGDSYTHPYHKMYSCCIHRFSRCNDGITDHAKGNNLQTDCLTNTGHVSPVVVRILPRSTLQRQWRMEASGSPRAGSRNRRTRGCQIFPECSAHKSAPSARKASDAQTSKSWCYVVHTCLDHVLLQGTGRFFTTSSCLRI